MTTISSIASSDLAPDRIFPAIIAMLAFGALAAQPLLGDYSYLGNLAAMLRFFTIWGNVGAFALVLGTATGFYAYFFLDLPSKGSNVGEDAGA